MDSTIGSRLAVRVNPRHLIGASTEESEIISTVKRPESHALFASKQVRFFGPIGIGAGAIPLRELLIGVGNRTGPDIQQADDLPKPNSTTFYCHYAGHPLDAKQFEVLWQFNRFVKGDNVVGIDNDRRECIMTLWNRVQRPSTTFDKLARKYHYENWTDAHFHAFFEEYCASKAAMAMVDPGKRDAASEWMKLRPPNLLTASEWQMFVAEIGYPWMVCSDEDCSKIDKDFKELLGFTQLQEAKPTIECQLHDEQIVPEPSRPYNRVKKGRNARAYRKPLKEKVCARTV